ncbi:MAG: serine/threonine protein kinase [Chitinispirillaceae bacterium]|nr:serine/threonine protein kinase [Chitinispirillaceae bacterium]
MNEKTRYETPIIKLAVERKLISDKQYDQCKELVKKSKRIGLESSIEEVLVKQGLLNDEKIQELSEILRLGETGDLFGGYRLQRLIGKGGMGKVYEAVHEFTGRKVALKVLNSQFSKEGTTITRFFQEVRALAKLTFPNIVTLYDAGKAGRRYYFAMELVEGPSLAQLVAQKKHLDEREALSITEKIARALAFSHANNVIHRDIKPENILLDERHTPKVTDFGVVMHQDDDHMTLTQEGFMVGSVHFSSPEQVEGARDIDGRSDIYSLGATLYYMLTGRTVYTGKNAEEVLTKHLVGSWTSPRRYNPAVSEKTVRLIRKMMARIRERRYQSMEEVATAVRKIVMPNLYLRVLIAAGSAIAVFLTGAIVEVVTHFIEMTFLR